MQNLFLKFAAPSKGQNETFYIAMQILSRIVVVKKYMQQSAFWYRPAFFEIAEN